MNAIAKRAPSAALLMMNIFLLFGCCMAALAGVTLLFPRSQLNAIWKLNPVAHAQMVPLGVWIGIPMLVLSGLMLAAALGWYRRRRWGWLLAVVIIATQLVGDAGNLITGRLIEGCMGVIIAGLLLLWLLSRRVRAEFLTYPDARK